jgi:hypothetical protein
LAKAQREDGGWSAADRRYDVAVTGLALHAFLGAGYPFSESPHKATVEAAVKFLRGSMDDRGCFGGRQDRSLLNHAIGTAAWCDTLGASNDPTLEEAARRAVSFLLSAQNEAPEGRGKLGWGASARSGVNDPTVTGWAVIALQSAWNAGVEVPDAAFAGARRWFESSTEPDPERVVSGPDEKARGLSPGGTRTALALFSRILAGEERDSETVKEATTLLLAHLPKWSADESTVVPVFWYHATLALFLVGGEAWRKWRDALTEAVCMGQLSSGRQRGSWNPAGPWTSRGGRVHSTALMVLSLEAARR